jgi:hypothetical protein
MFMNGLVTVMIDSCQANGFGKIESMDFEVRQYRTNCRQLWIFMNRPTTVRTKSYGTNEVERVENIDIYE